MGDWAGLCSGPRGQLAVPLQPWQTRHVAPQLEPGPGWGQGGLAALAGRVAEARQSSSRSWAMPLLHDLCGTLDCCSKAQGSGPAILLPDLLSDPGPAT